MGGMLTQGQLQTGTGNGLPGTQLSYTGVGMGVRTLYCVVVVLLWC